MPHVPDAWIDHDKTKIGYEIPFNRHFYVFKPPRELDEIDAELKGVTDRIVTMIGGAVMTEEVSGKASAAGDSEPVDSITCSSHGQPTEHGFPATIAAGENGRPVSNNHNHCWRIGVATG